MVASNDSIEIFTAAVDAVKPAKLLPQYLFWDGVVLNIGESRYDANELPCIFLLAVGKAAAAMVQEAERVLANNITNGLVVTKHGHALPLHHCKIIEAGHPVPDDNSLIAAKAVEQFLTEITPDSLLICLISGGASALIADIGDGIKLEDVQALSKLLLRSGADINEINTVRKHISTLKGGKLIKRANGAEVVSFIISDVLGDNLSIIASGLTVKDISTNKNAWEILEKYKLLDDVPLSIKQYLLDRLDKVLLFDDSVFAKVHNYIIGSNAIALNAASIKARQLGYDVHIINNALQGEARDKAVKFIDALLAAKTGKPTCLLMGGETTVTLTGYGKGGRNQEFVLGCLCELVKRGVTAEDVPFILSGGTDGTDGPTDAAGAFIDMNIFIHIQKLAINPFIFLQNNDAYNFFKRVDGLLMTGPTQTNVMDVVVGII